MFVYMYGKSVLKKGANRLKLRRKRKKKRKSRNGVKKLYAYTREREYGNHYLEANSPKRNKQNPTHARAHAHISYGKAIIR